MWARSPSYVKIYTQFLIGDSDLNKKKTCMLCHQLSVDAVPAGDSLLDGLDVDRHSPWPV